MEEFLKTNPGLRSRVPNNFIFEDFTGDEIVQLGEMILSKGDYKLEDRDYYARHVKRAYDGSLDKSNGRWIRNLDEQLTKTMADRVVAQGSDDIETILNSDIDAVLNQGKYQAGADKEEDGMAALNRLVGIAKVKEQVEQFVAMAEFNQNGLNKVASSKIRPCTHSLSWKPWYREDHRGPHFGQYPLPKGLSSRRNSSKYRGAIWLEATKVKQP